MMALSVKTTIQATWARLEGMTALANLHMLQIHRLSMMTEGHSGLLRHTHGLWEGRGVGQG